MLSKSANLDFACELMARFLAQQDYRLQGVTFCDLEHSDKSIVAYRNHSKPVTKLATELRKNGGCPIIREAKKRAYCFDVLAIDRSLYGIF